jgi:type VI secretion system protein ImpM
MPSLPSASLFGKLPSVLDFVRVHHTYPEALALDRWLAASQQYLQTHGQAWPEEALNFCFLPEGAEHGLVGVLAPSRDRAGRKYPVAILAPLPRALIEQHYAAVPLACARFLRAARVCLERAPCLPLEQLARSLARLPLPAADAFSEIDLDSQLSKPCDVDGLSTEEQERTFKQIFDATLAAAQERYSFAYPVASHEHASLWLRLTQLSHAGATPAFAWRAEATGRVLLAPNGLEPRFLSWWSASATRPARKLERG